MISHTIDDLMEVKAVLGGIFLGCSTSGPLLYTRLNNLVGKKVSQGAILSVVIQLEEQGVLTCDKQYQFTYDPSRLD